jgi:hypothetical protein
MGVLVPQFGGIDLKSNNLTRKDNMLRDARNICLDTSGYIVKRPGFDSWNTLPAFPIIDSYYIKCMNLMFYAVNESGIVEFYTQSEFSLSTKLTRFSQDIPFTSSFNLSCCEYLGSLEFTFTNGQTDVLKFDGKAVYYSGLPTPQPVVSIAGATNALIFYQFTDSNGIIINGPAKAFTMDAALASVTVSTFKTGSTTYGDGFFNKFITLDTFAVATEFSGDYTVVERTMNININNGFSVGDKVLVNAGFGLDIFKNTIFPDVLRITSLELIIESLTATTVTFTAASFAGYTVKFYPQLPGYEFSIGSRVRVIVSMISGATYSKQVSTELRGDVDNQVLFGFNVPDSVKLANYYDITTSKLRPPRCKYIVTYASQLVVAACYGIYDFDNTFNVFTSDDLLYYSDISTGDGGENFSAINYELIGDTYDGSITGIYRVRDSLAVCKTRGLFALDGVLVSGEYSKRKIETNGVGCGSFLSILSNQDYLFFHGQDGIYSFTGFKIDKVTTPLDPFFIGLDLTKTRSCMDLANDRWLFYLTDNTTNYIVAYDFNYKQWYIWDGIDCSKGLHQFNSGRISFINSAGWSLDQNLTSDSGTPFTAYLKTSWFDLNAPSFQKKIGQVRLFTMENYGATFQLDSYVDWSEATPKTSTLKVPSGKFTELRKIEQRIAQSWSLKISNSEDLKISIAGADFNVEPWQTVDKNE